MIVPIFILKFISWFSSDENFIVCSGQSETMHIFRIEDRAVAKIGAYDGKNKKKAFIGDVQWGALHQNDVSKLRSQEKKKLKKMEKKAAENVDEIAERLSAVNVGGDRPVKVCPWKRISLDDLFLKINSIFS